MQSMDDVVGDAVVGAVSVAETDHQGAVHEHPFVQKKSAGNRSEGLTACAQVTFDNLPGDPVQNGAVGRDQRDFQRHLPEGMRGAG